MKRRLPVIALAVGLVGGVVVALLAVQVVSKTVANFKARQSAPSLQAAPATEAKSDDDTFLWKVIVHAETGNSKTNREGFPICYCKTRKDAEFAAKQAEKDGWRGVEVKITEYPSKQPPLDLPNIDPKLLEPLKPNEVGSVPLSNPLSDRN